MGFLNTTMKIAHRLFLVFLVLFALVPPQEALARRPSAGGSVSVSGYTRSNGTYVAPYTRRAPGTASDSSSPSYPSSPSFYSEWRNQSHRQPHPHPEARPNQGCRQRPRRCRKVLYCRESGQSDCQTLALRMDANEIRRPSSEVQSRYSSATGVLRNSRGRFQR